MNLPRWGRVIGVWALLLALLCPAALASEDGSSLLDRRQVGVVSSLSGTVRVVRSAGSAGETVEGSVNIGDKIYIGDRLEASAQSYLEFTSGLNVRILLADGALLDLAGVQEGVRALGEQSVRMQRLVVTLRRGTARVRVRENLLTPTPVLMNVGDVGVLMPRSDVLLRSEGAGDGSGMLRVWMQWGRSRIASQDQWRSAETLFGVVGREQKALSRVDVSLSYIPEKSSLHVEEMTSEEMDAVFTPYLFGEERNREYEDRPPEDNPLRTVAECPRGMQEAGSRRRNG